jgi:hypothetical protein
MKIQKNTTVFWHNKNIDKGTIVQVKGYYFVVDWEFAGQQEYPFCVFGNLVIE